MNREIKFRAWTGRDMILSKESTASFFGDCVLSYAKQWNEIPGHQKDDETILMQYTGLKDKNGKDIYEGDIVVCQSPEHPATVVYCDGNDRYYGMQVGWLFQWRNGESWIYMPSDDSYGELEVVGNIHENPELLK